ncbi:MAG: hypothetical protein AABZ41_02355 [Bacteroidota bacterium]
MNHRIRNKGTVSTVTLFLLALSCAFFQQQTMAQPINVGNNITMSITTGVAGGTLTSVVNTARTLTYRRQLAIAKITVSTSCPTQSFTLKVLATAVPDGIAAPEVTLVNGMPATDFIVNIPVRPPNTARSCTLRYTASATFSQGNSIEDGNDVHTVTYTILAQ